MAALSWQGIVAVTFTALAFVVMAADWGEAGEAQA